MLFFLAIVLKHKNACEQHKSPIFYSLRSATSVRATLPPTLRIIGLIRLGRIPMLPEPQNQHAHGKQHDAERRHQRCPSRRAGSGPARATSSRYRAGSAPATAPDAGSARSSRALPDTGTSAAGPSTKPRRPRRPSRLPVPSRTTSRDRSPRARRVRPHEESGRNAGECGLPRWPAAERYSVYSRC